MTGFILRAADEGDLNFIRKTWMQSYAASAFARTVGHASYVAEHWKLRDRLMLRGALLIASREATPTAICGWSCTEGDRVHYVYVKERWRRQHVARLLLAPLLDRNAVCTHRSDTCAELPIPKPWSFNLYEAFQESP